MLKIKSKKTLITCFIFSMMVLQIGSLQTMEELIKELQQLGYINSEEVASTMLAVNRIDFLNTVEHNSERIIYDDSNLNIGFGATISAPSRQAEVLELMKDHLQGENKTVLDIGSGSGYITVCMAIMLGKTGFTVGTDHIPELVEFATKNALKHHSDLINKGNLKFEVGDGRHGFPKNAPYDVIHVGAGLRKVPYNILEQLKPGGRYVGPIGSFEDERGQFMTVIDKQMDKTIKIYQASKVFFRYLQDKNAQLTGNVFNSAPDAKGESQSAIKTQNPNVRFPTT